MSYYTKLLIIVQANVACVTNQSMKMGAQLLEKSITKPVLNVLCASREFKESFLRKMESHCAQKIFR